MPEQQTLVRPLRQAQQQAPATMALREGSRWTRSQWVALIMGFFLFQLGFVFVVIDHPAATKKVVKLDARVFPGVLTEERAARTFFASDPRLFPSASQHGFSGDAWLRTAAASYELPDEVEAPQWLTLRAETLGRFAATERRAELPFQLGQQSAPALEALPVFVPLTAPKTNSIVRVDAALAERAIGLPANLPTIASSDVLGNTVVDVAVNGAGEVVARRLVSASGSTQVDRDALERAKTLRFRALNSVGTIWGQAVFEWTTEESKK
jgi:hypothetical protein